MSANVGLSTPRGSGTSGYIQRNLSALKPHQQPSAAREKKGFVPYDKDDSHRHRQRQPNAEILEHDRKRAIEVKVFELRDRLEEEGKLTEEEIDDETDKLRKKLEKQSQDDKRREERTHGKTGDDSVIRNARGLKSHQVHELAKAKNRESERLRRALGISENYQEGSHWEREREKKEKKAAADAAAAAATAEAAAAEEDIRAEETDES